MNYYYLNGVIARGVNPTVYAGWEDLGRHPEFDQELTTHLVYDGTLSVDTNKKRAKELKRLESLVQNLLDKAAQARGYDNASSCISYLNDEVVPQYGEDAALMKAWRTTVWFYCYQNQDKIPEDVIQAILEAHPAPWDH